MGAVSGHVKLRERVHGDQWYLKYRTPSGRQLERKLGPAWKERSRPPAGYFTRKTAEIALAELLGELRRGEIPDPGVKSGRTFADAVAEWLRWCREDRALEVTTLRDYTNVSRALLEEFGEDTALEAIDEDRIDSWRTRMLSGKVVAKRGGRTVVEREDGRSISRRAAQKRLVLLGGVFKRARRLRWVPVDPTEAIEPITLKSSSDFNVLTVPQVESVVAEAEEMYAAAIVVAAFTGLRTAELRALRWRDVDFGGATIHVRTSKPAGGEEKGPKSERPRSVPLMDHAARVLDALSKRGDFTGEMDRVFVSATGGMLGADAFRDALYEAMKAAGVDRLGFPAKGGFVFHDLRHTFGTLAVRVWPLSDVQAYMGHADIQTTMRYVHHVPRTNAAREFTEAVDRMKAEEELLGEAEGTISPNVSRTAEIHA